MSAGELYVPVSDDGIGGRWAVWTYPDGRAEPDAFDQQGLPPPSPGGGPAPRQHVAASREGAATARRDAGADLGHVQ